MEIETNKWYVKTGFDLGALPLFFDCRDPRPARDQLHEAYAHGGGVMPFKGFELTLDRSDVGKATIKYLMTRRIVVAPFSKCGRN